MFHTVTNTINKLQNQKDDARGNKNALQNIWLLLLCLASLRSVWECFIGDCGEMASFHWEIVQ